MISFQQLLGRQDEFCDLLEASAEEAVHAVAALKRMLADRGQTVVLHEFADARSKDKAITDEISEKLITTFVTPMEREDIESLAVALYKIPKTTEKFAERYRITADKLQDVDFTRQTRLMESAVHLVLRMVQALRSGRGLGSIKTLQTELQAVESEADDVLLDLERKFYERGFPTLKAIILKDLFSLNEKVVDRCRDAGNVISHVLLKNS
ncbi:MAG TPA: DUF47 family protein [Candidatus Saccharimonadales bacterium]|nr:DUF47 family protein [Candidatus Saccharimonadales bacterium]